MIGTASTSDTRNVKGISGNLEGGLGWVNGPARGCTGAEGEVEEGRYGTGVVGRRSSSYVIHIGSPYPSQCPRWFSNSGGLSPSMPSGGRDGYTSGRILALYLMCPLNGQPCCYRRLEFSDGHCSSFTLSSPTHIPSS
jgi:hypothetical protein